MKWFFLILLALPALAGPPMITDDPGMPGEGVWELNLSVNLVKTRHVSSWQAPLFDLNYNVSSEVQLNAITSFNLTDPKDGGPVGGLGNNQISFKWDILQQRNQDIDVSIAPAIAWTNVGHPVRRGVVADGASVFLPVQVNKSIHKDLDLFGEVGYLAVQYGGDYWSYGVCLDWRVDQRLDLLAEIHMLSDTSFRYNDPVLNFGLTLKLDSKNSLLLSAGRSLRDDDRAEQFILFAGMQFHF